MFYFRIKRIILLKIQSSLSRTPAIIEISRYYYTGVLNAKHQVVDFPTVSTVARLAISATLTPNVKGLYMNYQMNYKQSFQITQMPIFHRSDVSYIDFYKYSFTSICSASYIGHCPSGDSFLAKFVTDLTQKPACRESPKG